jgi:hypothetical protein
MQQTSLEIPSVVRYSIIISTVFVTWVTLKSWLNPLDIHNMNNYELMNPELLNLIGMWTIPICFGIIIYFIGRYYDEKIEETIPL